jgi:hypothetical protein
MQVNVINFLANELQVYVRHIFREEIANKVSNNFMMYNNARHFISCIIKHLLNMLH